jgi:hypothetical protein
MYKKQVLCTHFNFFQDFSYNLSSDKKWCQDCIRWVAASCQSGQHLSGRCAIQSGWSDWANFCQLCDCFIRAVFWNIHQIFGRLFSTGKTYILIFYKEWTGLHFGRLFRKLIWSPWIQCYSFIALLSTFLEFSPQCVHSPPQAIKQFVNLSKKFCEHSLHGTVNKKSSLYDLLYGGVKKLIWALTKLNNVVTFRIKSTYLGMRKARDTISFLDCNSHVGIFQKKPFTSMQFYGDNISIIIWYILHTDT